MGALNLVACEQPMPRWTWDDLEAALRDFAVTRMQRDMVGPLVSAIRKQSPFLPPDHILKEVLAITYVVGDESFLAPEGEGPNMI